MEVRGIRCRGARVTGSHGLPIGMLEANSGALQGSYALHCRAISLALGPCASGRGRHTWGLGFYNARDLEWQAEGMKTDNTGESGCVVDFWVSC